MTRVKSERSDFRRLALVSAILLSAVLTFYTPAAIYSGNVEDFSFGLKHLLLVSAVPFIAIFLVLSLPALVLRNPFLKVYAYGLCILGFAAWLYSGVFVTDFGLLDGGSKDFGDFKSYKYYEIAAIAALWFVLYGLVIKMPRVFTHLVLLLNVGLIGLTAWSLLQDPKASSLEPRLNLDALYRFSSGQNVLIVLMDAFQSDVFMELLNDDPSLATKLEGFTFFPDTLGVAASTYLTLPSVHTGHAYKAEMNVQEFYSDAVRERSFLNGLAAAGHEVTLVNPLRGDCPKLVELCIDSDEIIFGKRWALVMETAHLLDVSLFRAVPFFYKETIYNNRFWRIKPLVRTHLTQFSKNEPSHIAGNQLLERLGRQSHVIGDRPVTKFLHLLNTHRPYVQDSDCNIVGEDRDDLRLGAKYQGRCALAAFTGSLDALRSKGLYESALIVLFADTGAALRSRYAEPPAERNEWRRLVGRANPIFLVKPPGAHGALRRSPASVQVSDLAATVCAITQDCHEDGGVSVFEIPAASHRPRLFWHYIWRNEYWARFPDIRGFELEGPIWERNSWTNYTDADRGRF